MNELKHADKGVDDVYLAADRTARRSDLLHLQEELKGPEHPAHLSGVFNESEKGDRESVEKPGQGNKHGERRRRAGADGGGLQDSRCLGQGAARTLGGKGRRWLRMVVEREREIRDHPEEYGRRWTAAKKACG